MRHKGLRVYSADFKDMFTNLSHSVMFNRTKGLLIICFKDDNKSYIAISGYKVFYTDNTDIAKKFRFIISQTYNNML